MIRLALRVQREEAEIVLAECWSSRPAGWRSSTDGDVVEYAVYGAPGELPDLPDLRAAAGAALVEVSTTEVADDWDERWKAFHHPVRSASSTSARRGRRRARACATSSSTPPRPSARARTRRRACASSCCSSSSRRARWSTSAAARACSPSPRRGWAGGRCSGSTMSASPCRPPSTTPRVNGVTVQARRHDLLRDGPVPGAPTVLANLLRPLLLRVAADGFAGARARRARRRRPARARGRRGGRAFAAPRPARGRAPPRRRVGGAVAAALGSGDERTREPDLPQRRGHVRRVALPPDAAAGAGAMRRHGPWLHGHPRGPAARLRRALRRRRPRGPALRLPPLRRLRRHAAPAAGHRPPAGRLPRRRRLRAHPGGHRRAAHRALRHLVLRRPRRRGGGAGPLDRRRRLAVPVRRRPRRAARGAPARRAARHRARPGRPGRGAGRPRAAHDARRRRRPGRSRS